MQHTKDKILGTNAYKNSAYRCKIFSTFNRVPFYTAINRIDEAICEMKINFILVKNEKEKERKKEKRLKTGRYRAYNFEINLKLVICSSCFRNVSQKFSYVDEFFLYLSLLMN